MNRSMLVGSVLGAVVATAGGAIASYSFLKKDPEFAQVVAVQELKEAVKTPRQQCHDENVQTPREECHDVSVTHQRPVKDSSRVTGSLLGAVIGGVIGHQVGSGRGKEAATVAAAAAGGYAGNQVQKGMQQRDTYTTTEHRCNTVTDTHTEQKCETVFDQSEKTVGYDVTYKIGDAQNKVRMDHNPGDRIPIKDGILVLTDPNAAPQGQTQSPAQPVTSANAQ